MTLTKKLKMLHFMMETVHRKRMSSPLRKNILWKDCTIMKIEHIVLLLIESLKLVKVVKYGLSKNVQAVKFWKVLQLLLNQKLRVEKRQNSSTLVLLLHGIKNQKSHPAIAIMATVE